MKLSLEMTNKDILDPGRTVKGRLFLQSFLLVPFFIFTISTWNDLRFAPGFYIFVTYVIFLLTLGYKYSEYYYKFADLYRKTEDPGFPLTRNEHFEKYAKGELKSNYVMVFPSRYTFGKFKNKEVARLAKKANIYLILSFISPIIFLLLSVAIGLIIY